MPDTIPVPLDAIGMAGVVAHVQPLDAEALARWFDAFVGKKAESFALLALARKQLRRVEGLSFQNGAGDPVAFDVENPIHKTALLDQPRVFTTLASAITARAGLNEEQKKRSDSPSDSGTPLSGETSPAGAAATSPEIGVSADSQEPDDPDSPGT